MISTDQIEQARLQVRRHFSRHLPKWMAFHDLEHTLSVARYAADIGRACGLGSQDLRLLELAARVVTQVDDQGLHSLRLETRKGALAVGGGRGADPGQLHVADAAREELRL